MSRALIILLILTASLGPVSHADEIDDGLAWLINAQGADGAWGNEAASPVTDFQATHEVLETLAGLEAEPTFSDGLNWLGGRELPSVDHLARALLAYARINAPLATWQMRLLAARNADGGWGLDEGFTSDNLDTALALQALARSGVDPASLSGAVDFLLAARNADASLGLHGGDAGEPYYTALLLLALVEYQRAGGNGVTGAIDSTCTWLADGQAGDGGWGTVADTGLTAYALALAGCQFDAALTVQYLQAAQSANGSWNANAYDSALALRALLLLGRPNLVAESLTLDPATPVQDESVTLAAVIANRSAVGATDIRVRFYDGDPQAGGSPLGTEQTIAALDPGATATVQITTTFPDLGARDLFVVADPQDLIPEANEGDNATSQSLVVVVPAPDLTVTAVTFVPATPGQGQDFTVQAQVSNVGRLDAPAGTLRFYSGDPGAGGTALTPDQPLPALAVGASTTVGLTLSLAQAGNTTLFALADPDDALAESREDNNQASATVAIQPVADLAVSDGDITFNPASPSQGEPFTLSAVIRNLGAQQAPAFRVQAWQGDPSAGGSLLVEWTVTLLGPGASLTLQANDLQIGQAGDVPIFLVVDAQAAVTEISEDNNRASRTVTVQPLPDLAVTAAGLAVTPALPQPGSDFQLSATIANLGAADAPASVVRFYDGDPDAGGQPLGGDRPLAALAAGEEATVTLTTRIDDAGRYQFFVQVDPDESLREADEANNQARRQVNVSDFDPYPWSQSFIVAVDDSSRLYTARSNGDGTFSDFQQLWQLGGYYARGVVSEDFDGDGDLDFVAVRGEGNTAYFHYFRNDAGQLLNQGIVGTLTGAGSYGMDLAAGDFDNDGRPDFVGNVNSGNTGVFLNRGDGTFEMTVLSLASAGRGMDAADFNGDGNLDLARATNGGLVQIHLGQGNGTFQAAQTIIDVGSDTYGLTAADFDNDGAVDLIANSANSGNAYLLKGNGLGNFADQGLIPELDFNNYGAFDAYDLNGDGNVDLLAVDYSSRGIWFYPGNGDGSFAARTQIGTTQISVLGVSAPPYRPFGRPYAVAAPDSQTLAVGGSANLDGSASRDSDDFGTLTAWQWQFGDGQQASGETLSHDYGAAPEDIYDVTLTVIDDQNRRDRDHAQVILQGAPPQADPGGPYTAGESDALEGGFGVSVDGSASSDDQGIIRYSWDFGDGFEDDFEGNLAPWTVQAGTWSLDNGTLLQTDTALDRPMILTGAGVNGDYRVEATVEVEAGSGEEAILVLRAVDDNNRYELLLRGRNLDDLVLYRITNGSSSVLVDFDLPFEVAPGTPHRLRVDAQGGTFSVYLDDRFAFSASDTTHSRGRVGLAGYRSQVRYDDFRVTSTAEGPTASHNYAPGQYDLALTVTDGAGQTSTAVTQVTVSAGDPPVAEAGPAVELTGAQAVAGEWTVDFDASGSSDDVEIVEYRWDFGDGNTLVTDQTQVSHTYVPTEAQRPLVVYDVTLTVMDRAGQTGLDTTTVTIDLRNDTAPVIDTGGPYQVDEGDASFGQWTVQFDATGSTDDNGIARYEWDFDDSDGITVESMEASPVHLYDRPGTYTVTLRVYDETLQMSEVTFQVTVAANDPPVADAGGPYVLGEADAGYGVWTATLDGRNSTDDFAVELYEWVLYPDRMLDDFTTFDPDDWLASGVSVANEVLMSGIGGWSNRYLFTQQTFPRTEGAVFQMEVRSPADNSSQAAMFGLKDAGTDSFSYTRMPHAIYFSNGTLQIYEDGSNRGNRGSYVRGAAYELRITLKAQGALYQIRRQGQTTWTTLYDSDHSTTSPLRLGATVYSGAFAVDNFSRGAEIVRGAQASFDLTEPGEYPLRLRVQDRAVQSAYDTTTITVEAGAAPVADAGGPYNAEVGNFIFLDATGSTDDVEIESYHWSFGDSTGGAADLPYTGKGPRPRHFYRQPGTYTATLTVTDNIGQSATDTALVTVVVGDAPTANAGGPYQGGVDGPPAYFDGRGSEDDYGVVEYLWDFDDQVDQDGDGNFTNDADASGPTPFHVYDLATLEGTPVSDDFTGTALDTGRWLTAGASQSGVLTLSGNNSWGATYLFSTGDFPRARMSLRARVRSPADGRQEAMIGFKNPDTGNFSYTQMHHALYFDDGTLRIYEDGSNRGTVGSYTPGTLYEVRIDIKAVGADYFIREVGAADWTALTGYNSLGRSNAPLKVGATVGSGDFQIDDLALEGAGPYVVTLTVLDGAGQSAQATARASVAANLPPHVITVPWVSHDPIAPHETYDGKAIHLKGIVRDADAQEFQWIFGDGTQSARQAITDDYDLSVVHTYPAAVAGTPFTARLRVWDSAGNMGEDTYNVVVRPRNLTTEINIAIDEGLWYLHQTQTRQVSNRDYTIDGYPAGYWTSNARPSATASALQAFAINGHQETSDPRENPYAETVDRGFKYLFTRLRRVDIATQAYGEPDTNGNDFGLEVDEGNSPYQGGQVMDAIASSARPLARPLTGREEVKGRRYHDIVTDMVDQYAWGQYDDANTGGGWRYGWNSFPDNSAAQWGAIGMLAAQDIWNIPIPQWVKERNLVWLDYSYNGSGFGYTNASTGVATTPSGLVQLTFDDQTTDDPRWQGAENWIADNWDGTYLEGGNNKHYYAFYALTKAMRLAKPEPVVNLVSGLDWFGDPDRGLARTLIDDQQADGSFPGTEWIRDQLRSAWGVIILSRTLFVQPPVADAGRDRVWAIDEPYTFDGSDSYHLDPFRSIVRYEWDFDGDGVYDSSSTQPTAVHTFTSADYPSLPTTITATLRVTDNNVPPLTATDTVEVIIAIPPHPPIAEAGGPYTCTVGVPCRLDGSNSRDFDPTDFIARYEWELDGVFPFDFDEAAGARPEPVFDTPGVVNIGLRVWDNGVLNDLDGDDEVDENERLSDQHFVQVTVVENLAPSADAGGPYQVEEGSTVALDGSASSDPNGDTLSYGWDLNDDGQFDDASGVSPDFLGVDDGVYPVALEVSDSVLTDQATSQVTVVNVAPTVEAGPDQASVEGQSVGFDGSFTDPGLADTHTIEWDFGDGNGSSGSLTPDHTYAEDGIYTVTLTVTDDDGGVGSDTLTVTVSNAPPVVEAGVDQTVLTGATVSLDPASFTDPGVEDTHSASIDWGDGTVEAGTVGQGAGSGTVDGSHAYASPGSYTVTVTVTDDDGGVGSDTLTVTVNDPTPTNDPPQADAGGPYQVVEGSAVTLSGAGSTDPDGDTLSYAWDLDNDGQYDDASGQSVNFTGVDDGTYTVGLEVSDGEFTDTDTAQVTVLNVAPTVEAGPDRVSVEGQSIGFNGSFTDPGSADTHTIEWDFGDGSGASGSLTPDHIYAQDGVYTVTLTVTDDDGGVGSDTLTVTVNDPAPTNNPPQADAGGPYTMTEGGTVTLTGAGSSDPDGDTLSYAWDLDNDGLYDDASGETVDLTIADDGVYTVGLEVSDGEFQDTDTAQVTVSNVAPVVEAGSDQTVQTGATVSLDPATFTDAGVLDTHTASIDWGDGTVEAGTVGQGAGSGTVGGSHTYATPGSYPVTVTVTDDDGGVGSDSLTVTVEAEPLEAIDDLLARPKLNKVDLVWTPVAGAEGYNVYRAGQSGGPWQPIAVNHQCDYCVYADLGLTTGETYHYVVTVIAGGVESPLSNEASATLEARRRR